MKLHANAALSLNQRRRLARRVVEEDWSLAEAAKAAEVSDRTVRKWVARYRADGEEGLLDRPSAPRRIHNRTDERRIQTIAALRRLRFTGPEIAEVLEMATSTVSAVLKRIGLGKLSRLEPPEPIRRYQKQRPGELVHIDIKKLGRISVKGAGHRVTGHKRSRITRRNRGPSRGATGWEFVHICVDDATRLAYAEVMANERAVTAVASCGACSPSIAPTGSSSSG
jgi:transposase